MGTNIWYCDSNFISDTADLSFDAPSVSVDETLTFELTVQDNDNASATTTVSITISAFDNLDTISISDNGIQRCLTELSDVDLGVKEIVCDGEQISSLDDLKQLPMLEKIVINNANLVDISSLSELTELTHLNLADNAIVDLEAVFSLTILIEVEFSNDGVSQTS
jgi:Leucine-rich repeat (LRR) protein